MPFPPMNKGTNGGLGNQAQDPYAGYGFKAPRPACPPGPEEALAECIRAMQSVLERSLQMSDLAPWIHPPYRARSFCVHTRTILSTTAGFNAALNAAGLALQAALTVPGSPALVPEILEMDADGDFQTVFDLQEPISILSRIKSWGITVGNVAPEGVLLTVATGSTAGGPPTPPNPLLSAVDVASHQDVFLLVPGQQKLEIKAALRDTTLSPAVIDVGVCGWTWPVRVRGDSPKDAIPRSGYGLDCR